MRAPGTPINIGYVQSVAERGGAEVILLNIIRHLDRHRFAPTVFILADGPLVREVESAGAEVVVLPSFRTRDLRGTLSNIGRVAEGIRARDIRLVHSHNSHAHLIGGHAARKAGAKALLHLHGIPRPSFDNRGALALAGVLAPTDCTLAVSHFVARRYHRSWLGLRSARVIHNGINLETLGAPSDAAAPSVREELGLPPGAPLVLLPARLQRGKGIHVFLEAAALLRERHPEARFVVAGGTLFGLEPRYPDQLRLQAHQLGIEDRVVFAGHRNDIYRLMRSANLVVNCSVEFDSFPTVILEAMAMERPVIATPCGGAPESVEPGVTGLLTPPGDAPALARAIAGILDVPETGAAMGRAGRRRLLAHFTAERMLMRIHELYCELLRITPRTGRAPATEPALPRTKP